MPSIHPRQRRRSTITAPQPARTGLANFVYFSLLNFSNLLVVDYFICCNCRKTTNFEALSPESSPSCPHCGHVIDYTGDCEKKYSIQETIMHVYRPGLTDGPAVAHEHRKVTRAKAKTDGLTLVFPFKGEDTTVFWTWEPGEVPKKLDIGALGERLDGEDSESGESFEMVDGVSEDEWQSVTGGWSTASETDEE